MPSRIRGVTPRRRTRVIMNYPVPNITTPSFSLKRQYDEIAPVKNSKNVDVKFTPGTGWMLEQYHETVSYVHELAVADGSVIAGAVPTGVLFNKIQRRPTELTNLGTTTIRTSGDNFYQKTVSAGGNWDAAKLSADETSYPPPSETENVLLDRVYVSTANDEPHRPNWFRFYIPGSSGQTPVQLVARFYFTAMPSNRANVTANQPTGQYCLSLYGDATFILREKLTDNTWTSRYSGRWCKPQNVVGRWHMVGIGSDIYYDSVNNVYNGTTLNLRFEDLDSDLIVNNAVSGIIPAAKIGNQVVVPTNTYSFNNVTNWQPVPSKVRIDIRRDTRMKFNVYFGQFKPTGTFTTKQFALFTFTGTTTQPIKVTCYGSFPAGTSIDIELFAGDGTACTPTGATTQFLDAAFRDFTGVQSARGYFARITLNSATGSFSPIIKSILYARSPAAVYSNPTPVTVTGSGQNGVESVSISGEGRDFTTSTASIVINDLSGVYANLLDNKAGFPIKVEVDTLDANDTVISTTRVFEGRVVRAMKKTIGRSRKPGVPSPSNTNPVDPYQARFWGKYTLYCTGMWQTLYESTLPTLSNFAEDPNAPGQPYKVGQAIEELFTKSGWPVERFDVPNYAGTGVGANRFPVNIITAASIRIEPYSKVGNVIVEFARNFLGSYVTYDYNAFKTGVASGLFRVILPPVPNPSTGNYTRLAAFRTTNTTDAGITVAEGRMASVTNYNGGTCKQIWIERNSLTEWVEPPEGNFVIATGTGYASTFTGSTLSSATDGETISLSQTLFNYPAANFGFPSGPPNNFPQPDPTHPDYVDGRQIPILISNASLQTQAAVDLIARRVLDNACHTKKKKSFTAPLWFVDQATTGDTLQIAPRPLKYGDVVTVDDVFYVVMSCSYQWAAGEGNNQMMAIEVMNIPAFEAAYTGSTNQIYKTIVSETHQ
jgi:hypothetical protein